MNVILKTMSGLNVTKDGVTVKLRGYNFIEYIKDDDWCVIKEHAVIKDMLDKGFLIETTQTDSKLNENLLQDSINRVKQTQNIKQNNNASKTGVRVRSEKA